MGIWEKQFLFSRARLLRGFRHNEGGGGEAEKYLRLPSAPGMSGGADKKIPFHSHNGAVLHLSCPSTSVNMQQLNTGPSSLGKVFFFM